MVSFLPREKLCHEEDAGVVLTSNVGKMNVRFYHTQGAPGKGFELLFEGKQAY